MSRGSSDTPTPAQMQCTIAAADPMTRVGGAIP